MGLLDLFFIISSITTLVYCLLIVFAMYIMLHVSAPVISHLQGCARSSYIHILYTQTPILYIPTASTSLKMAHYRSQNM
jgi:hypothetical protein